MKHAPQAAARLRPGEASGARPAARAAAAASDLAPRALADRERFLAACRGEAVDRPPVWLMRQAGRVLPEYRALKAKHDFLELVRTPELAAEVTLQPVRRFGFDAAILFSDILVVAEALGQAYRFNESGGVQMEFALHSAKDIARLNADGVAGRLRYVAEAVRLLKSALDGRVALIGFAGSPWTLANFMMEGGSAKEFVRARELFYADRQAFERLGETLTRAITEYLQMQVEAGVDAVQIFDTLGGLLPAHAFEAASAQWLRQIIAGLRGRVPVIVFSKGANGSWPTLVDTGASVLGVDWTVSLARLRETLPARVGIQGNLDPAVLTATPAVVTAETRRILEEMRGRPGHIFNLGHGVPPAAKLENIEALVHTLRSFA
jgi:uroporphyrinogen decarboxylase